METMAKVLMTIIVNCKLHLTSVCVSVIVCTVFYWQNMPLRYRNEKTALNSTQKKNIKKKCEHRKNCTCGAVEITLQLQSSYTSWRSCLLGHKFSSTSQRTSSLAMQRGKNLLECLIQPLLASAVMSSHAASMAARRVICVCGWRSYTFHLHAEKNSSMGLRNEE